MGERALGEKTAAIAEGQVVDPDSGEFMSLIEAGEAALGGNVEGILDNDGAAKADGGGIIERLGKDVSSAETQAFGEALANANRGGVKDGIAFGGFVDERSGGFCGRELAGRCRNAGGDEGAFGIEASAFG